MTSRTKRATAQGHPQFWGIIAGTSGDAEESQWLLARFAEAYRSRIDFASCQAWINDSSAACTDNTQRACARTAAGC